MKCVWCKKYFALPKNRTGLCSACYSKHKQGYHGGCFTLRDRKTVPGLRKKTLPAFYAKDRLLEKQGVLEKVIRLTESSDTWAVKFAVYPNFKEAEILWYHFAMAAIWLSTSQADSIYATYRHLEDAWKFQHAIYCRVVDWWNISIKISPAAKCYYGYGRDKEKRPKEASQVCLPEGKPTQSLSF